MSTRSIFFRLQRNQSIETERLERLAKTKTFTDRLGQDGSTIPFLGEPSFGGSLDRKRPGHNIHLQPSRGLGCPRTVSVRKAEQVWVFD